MQLQKIHYSDLNGRQKENFNFQKISAVLADYGFVTMRLSDDWAGADFIALHVDGVTTLRVQLKSRLTINRKYEGKGLSIAFPVQDKWYLGPHDELRDLILKSTSVGDTESWVTHGGYSMGRLSSALSERLEQYQISGDTGPIETTSTDPAP